MQVSEAMTREVQLATPEQSLLEVARIMAECDVGCLPVAENNRLVGMITDRDIAIRAVAQGKSPSGTQVREIMSPAVRYCFDDSDIAEVVDNMSEVKVHRLPVLNRHKHLVGILALSDIANCEGIELAGTAVCALSSASAPGTPGYSPTTTQH